jgi:hypothetical protein
MTLLLPNTNTNTRIDLSIALLIISDKYSIEKHKVIIIPRRAFVLLRSNSPGIAVS